MNRYLPALLIVVGIATGACNKPDSVAAQPSTASATQPAAAVVPQATTASSMSYPPATKPGRVLAGDLLGIEVLDLAAPGSAALFPKKVASDGTISMPYISRPVMAAGLTDESLAEAIVTAYREENVIQRAEVDVRRLQIAGTGGPAPGPIAPYDLVRVAVWDLVGPGVMSAHVRRVGGDGKMNLPYIGPQKLAGLSESQAEAAIAKAFKEQNIIARATVSILRLESAPPDAGNVDLPDVAIYPVPHALWWLYEPQETRPQPSK